jgi:hypothetical protein
MRTITASTTSRNLRSGLREQIPLSIVPVTLALPPVGQKRAGRRRISQLDRDVAQAIRKSV